MSTRLILRPFAAWLPLVLLGPLAAQTTPLSSRPDLVGWVHGAPSGQIHVQQTPTDGCKLVRRCPDVLGTAASAVAGGTAYDPRFQGVWSSEGTNIALQSLRDCRGICRGPAVKLLGNSVVSGLGIQSQGSRLYQLETVPGSFGIVTYDIEKVGTQCFRPVNRCIGRTLTPRGVAAGLAVDPTLPLLYIGTTEFTATGREHYILVTRAAAPCTILCRWKIPAGCFTGASFLTGLAYDGCRKRLYATNQVNHLEISVLSATGCVFRVGRCCQSSGRYGGLAVVTGWTQKRLGKSCARLPCRSCPDMRMVVNGGDPGLGNPNFSIELHHGPAGANAGLWLGLGCSAGIPYLCGRFYANPLLGPFVRPIVGTGCQSRARWPLPLGTNPALCGMKICAQALVVCGSQPAGIAMTDAIEFTLGN